MFFLRERVLPLFAAAVLFAGIAGGQTFSTDHPNGLSVNLQPGQTTSTVLNVTATSALTFNASAVTYSGGNWLAVSPNSNLPTPYAVLVIIDATRLSTGVYTGAIQIAQTTNQNNAITVGVTLSVGTPSQGNPTLIVSPSTLSFTGQVGGLVPTPQALSVTSAAGGLTFAAAASTTDFYNWLQVSVLNATTPAMVTVSVNTAGMPAGSYTGNVQLTPVTGSTVNVPVTLSLNSGTTISANVSSLQFYYQVGSFLPSAQTFTVTSSGNGAIPINIATTTKDMYNWLSATPVNAYTPQTIVVTVAPSQLPIGIYTGNIHISSGSAAGAVDIPVTLSVNINTLVTVGAAPTTFVYQTGSTAPPAQTVPIAVTSGSLSYTVATSTSDGTQWLGVSPLSGQLTQAAQNLTITVNPLSLATGNYTGNVIISAPGAANSPVTIPISLSVNTTSTLTVSPQSLVINTQTGTAAGQILSQPLYLDSTGGSVAFIVSAVPTSCGATWLSAFPAIGTTPATITVATNPSGLGAPQTCTGTVAVTPAGSSTPVQVPVVLNISTTPLFNVTPLSLNFIAPFGGDVTAAKTVSLSVTDGSAVAFTALASATLGGTWLNVNPNSGNTPANLSVTANPAYLSVGTYNGSITISSNALTKAVVIPVSLKVTPVGTAVATPASLSFTQVVGGSAPLTQTFTLTSTGGTLTFGAATSTADNTGWLTLNQYQGNTPSTIGVNVNGRSLPAGSYKGYVSVSVPGASNNPLIVPVTLTMTNPPSIAVDRSSLTFSYQQGAAAPSAQSVSVTSTGGVVNVAASVATGSNWLSVSPASGTTPVSFSVSVSPGSLAVGGYDGAVTLTPAVGPVVTINVHLDVAAPPVLVTSIAAVVNGASGVRGPVAPGEIVIIAGDALGPANGAGLVLDNNGKVSTTVAGTQVFFDEFAAPILYTSTHQVNAVVPYEVIGRSTVKVAVVYQGTRSASYTMQSAATAPGIFTATQNGRGQAAILNQDNSYNGKTAPAVAAARGSIVQVFATGEGMTNPPNVTGGVTPDASYVPVGGVTATVGGVPAEVIYKGSAPGAVAGLFQVNVRIPQSAPAGDVSILISVGGMASQSGVTVAVK